MSGLEIKEEPSIVHYIRLSPKRTKPTGSSATLKWALTMPQPRLISSDQRLVPLKSPTSDTLKAQLKCSGVSQTKISNGRRELMSSSPWLQLRDWLTPSPNSSNGSHHSLTPSETLSMPFTSTAFLVLFPTLPPRKLVHSSQASANSLSLSWLPKILLWMTQIDSKSIWVISQLAQVFRVLSITVKWFINQTWYSMTGAPSKSISKNMAKTLHLKSIWARLHPFQSLCS